jgi:hypothetical protein
MGRLRARSAPAATARALDSCCCRASTPPVSPAGVPKAFRTPLSRALALCEAGMRFRHSDGPSCY